MRPILNLFHPLFIQSIFESSHTLFRFFPGFRAILAIWSISGTRIQSIFESWCTPFRPFSNFKSLPT